MTITYRRCFVGFLALSTVVVGCHHQKTSSFIADISIATNVPGMPTALHGKLYLRGNRLRADWGPFADVFDMRQRKGWRVIPHAHGYMELAGKDLSTYAPEMSNGSPCPHAEVPSACKLVGNEVIEGRTAKKWDLYSPTKGFHVYFWTDAALDITLRMAIGDAASYQVKNFQENSVADKMFELPAGYERLQRPFTP